MGFWDTITGLFPGNKDKQDDPAENDRRQAFLLAKVGYPIINGDNAPDDSGATEAWGVSAGIERGLKAPEAQPLYVKTGGMAPEPAPSGATSSDPVAAESPTINDEVGEALRTETDLTGKVQLPPAEPADRQEAAVESGEAEWPALSLDWKSGQENRSGDGALLPYFNFSLPTGTTLSSQRDAAAYEMERYSTQWKVTLPETTVMIGNKVVDAFTVSFANTLVGTAEAGYNTLAHPVDTAKGITSAVGDIVADPEAAWKEVQENAQTVAHTITDGSAEDRAGLLGSGLGFAVEGTLIPMARAGWAKATGKGAVQGASKAAEVAGKTGRYTGELVKVNKADTAADLLAQRIGGQARVKFANDSIGREFDVVSSEYIGQTKPALQTLNKSVRDQMKATFEAAQETGKKVYYHFEGQPAQSVIDKLYEYSQRYGIDVIIDVKPLK